MSFVTREMEDSSLAALDGPRFFVERSRSVKRKTLRFGMGFRVAIGNRRSEAAEMVIGPGDAEGDRCNRHRGSDQWLYVVSGTGIATVNAKRPAGASMRIATRHHHVGDHGEQQGYDHQHEG